MANRRGVTKRIIFHHSLSDHATAAEIDQWHKERGFECIGYHYVIQPDGTIEHGRDVRDIGAHAHGKNHDSIGVCLVGDFRKYEPTVPQLEACGQLYHDLCRAYQKSLIIDFHRAIDNPCPGPKLNREDFQEVVGRCDPYL